jgi:hypothetical protein
MLEYLLNSGIDERLSQETSRAGIAAVQAFIAARNAVNEEPEEVDDPLEDDDPTESRPPDR